MIALAVGLGALAFFALRRARRRCYGSGYRGYGWYGPWSSHDGDACEGDDEHGEHGAHGEHGEHGGPGAHGPHGPHGPHGGHGRHGWHRGPWMRRAGWRGTRRRRWMLHAALSRIDATPAQERVIVGEIDRLTERVRDVRGGLQDANVDLAAALRGPVLDDAALGAVLGRADAATTEVRAAALDALRNIHAVLDDKQRAELADIIETRSFRGRRDGERGRGGSGRGWFRMGPYR